MDLAPFRRHVLRCNSLETLEGLVPFRIGGATVGWLSPAVARAIAARPETISEGGGLALVPTAATPTQRSEALGALVAYLHDEGMIPRLRGEAYDVRARPGAPSLATIDRAAIPLFGIAAEGVHVNGLVRGQEGLRLWIGVRARDKTIAPGKLDTVIGGGIAAGQTAWETVCKEAEEEASLPASLATLARPVGRVRYAMAWREPGQAPGLRRDTLHLFDLDLPAGVVPRPNDGEVERFELWPIQSVLEAVRDTDSFKFNVALVLIDLFLREGLIPPGPAAEALRASLDRSLP